MNEEQTSVEWLMEMLVDNKYLNKDASHLFEAAKKIEQGRVEAARVEGMKEAFQTTKEMLGKELNEWKKMNGRI